MRLTNWKKNINVFLVTTFFQWFYVAIGVWVLIWRQYLSWEEIGIVTAIGLFVSLLLELPSGALADLVGRRVTVIIGRALGVAGFIVFCYAKSFEGYIVANILYQANWAFESGALSALLYDSLKENGQDKQYYQKTESNGFLYATIGMAVASVLGGYLYEVNNVLPYLSCVVASVIALITSFQLEEPATDSEKFSLKAYVKQNWEGTIHIFRNPMIKAISFFSILIDFIAYVGLWYLYEPRLTEAGFPSAWMGWLVGGTYMIRAIGTMLIPVIMKFKDKDIPLILTVMQAVGSFLSFWETKVGAISSVYTRKFSDGFRKPILDRLRNDEIESKYRATSLSAISLFANLLIAAVGPLVGWGINKYSVAAMLGISGFVGLLTVLPAAIQIRRLIIKSQS